MDFNYFYFKKYIATLPTLAILPKSHKMWHLLESPGSWDLVTFWHSKKHGFLYGTCVSKQKLNKGQKLTL